MNTSLRLKLSHWKNNYTYASADTEPRQTYYRSANAKTYWKEYVLSTRTNDNSIAIFNR